MSRLPAFRPTRQPGAAALSTGLVVGLAVGLIASLCTSAPAVAAGRVEVRFIHPEQFTDTGFGMLERERTLRTLGEHLQTYAQRLPDAQTLSIEVLDVDLAGEVWPRGATDFRVLRGGIDWPRVTLRYTVSADGQTLKQGEERISDHSYLFGRRADWRYGELPYERRMLDHWFNERFSDEPR